MKIWNSNPVLTSTKLLTTMVYTASQEHVVFPVGHPI